MRAQPLGPSVEFSMGPRSAWSVSGMQGGRHASAAVWAWVTRRVRGMAGGRNAGVVAGAKVEAKQHVRVCRNGGRPPCGCCREVFNRADNGGTNCVKVCQNEERLTYKRCHCSFRWSFVWGHATRDDVPNYESLIATRCWAAHAQTLRSQFHRCPHAMQVELCNKHAAAGIPASTRMRPHEHA